MSFKHALLAISFLPLLACSTAMDQGTIFTATTIAAGAESKPQRDFAIYVVNGTIREVGPSARIQQAHPSTTVIDWGTATLLPGLTDAHAHLYGLGLALDEVDLVDTASFDEITRRVMARVPSTPSGEWVLGRGWDQNDWPTKEFPTAAELDRAVGERPVWLKRIDGHAGIASSAAMRLAGITNAVADPEGGRVIRDEQGRPTGVFVDAAMNLVERVIPAPTFEQKKRRVAAAARKIAENGLTEIHDAGADDETIRAVRELIEEKKFPIRVYIMVSDEPALLDEWFARGPLVAFGDRLTIRSIKVYADGALGSRGAAMTAPYSDDPHNHGLMIAQPKHIEEVARRARAAGFQVNTHAIGDAGVRNVIDAYEAAGVGNDDRFRIEHLQVLALEDLPRLQRSGIIASMQPTHATSDMPWAERRVGPQRVLGAYAWRRVLNAGARLALGSDFPVEDVNPWYGIYSAVTRQDHQGHPPGGWYPSENLTLDEAIRGFTKDAAWAAFEEKSRGTIEPGKLADFTVVEGDLYAAPLSDLFRTKTKATVVAGEVVYGAEQ